MVLCHSRQLYVEFTLGQSQEQWLAYAPRAGQVFNATYVDFAQHYGFTIKACAPRRPQQKGRVENGVGYIKKNFLAGLELDEFAPLNPAARVWLDTVANVRLQGETNRRPQDLFLEEKPHLRPLPIVPYDAALVRPVRMTNRCRVVVVTNCYSVPPVCAGQLLTLKLYAGRLRLQAGDNVVAEHFRSYE